MKSTKTARRAQAAWMAAGTLLAYVWMTASQTTSGSPAVAQRASAVGAAASAGGATDPVDPVRVMGLVRGDCKKCHPSEVISWTQTYHAHTLDKIAKYEGNTKKYADAMNVAPETLLTTSLCANCHGMKADVDGKVRVLSGVSCESCHGASGGEEGWLNRHQSYNASMPVPRGQETPEHRAERIEACESAGMIRSERVRLEALNCLSCHLVGNEQLLSAGHPSLKATFDFNAWTAGEVRHNYFINRDVNADAPSLWAEETGLSKAERERVKFVVGALATLEYSLRVRAKLTNPAIIPGVSGFAAAANGKLAQINSVAATPQTQSAAGIFAPMLATIFAPTPNDEKIYTEAADKIAKLTGEFLKENDGSKLAALDAFLAAVQPYYSQQYQK